MKLSDVVSAMNISVFATVPLLIFFGIFVGVVLYVTIEKDRFDVMSRLPLERNGERK